MRTSSGLVLWILIPAACVSCMNITPRPPSDRGGDNGSEGVDVFDPDTEETVDLAGEHGKDVVESTDLVADPGPEDVEPDAPLPDTSEDAPDTPE